MKKTILSLTASAVFAVVMLCSCATINSGASLSDNSYANAKMGEAKSTIILGLWSSKGEENNIKEAAKNGGISKITHVEYIDKMVCFGLWIEHTTRVYGE